jgi:hypothetical protein
LFNAELPLQSKAGIEVLTGPARDLDLARRLAKASGYAGAPIVQMASTTDAASCCSHSVGSTRPADIADPAARAMYWDMMNRVRAKPWVHRFVVSGCLEGTGTGSL